MTLATPFTGQAVERAKTAWRAGGLQFTEAGTVLLSESDRDTRMRRTWLFDGGLSAAPRKIGPVDPALVTLMVGVGIPLSFVTLPAWLWLLERLG